MLDTLPPVAAFVGLILCGAVLGLVPIRKLVQVREAQHELKHGSAGYLRTIGGWSIIAFWLVGTWFCATITGDWWATGDLDGAIARSGRRLEVKLHILSALSDG